jgi:hypothetical protein
MRHLIDLFEEAVPFPTEGSFLAKVKGYIDQHLSDWSDEYTDQTALSTAISNAWSTISSEGSPGVYSIEIYRHELRPQDQIDDRDFGSIGACWTWDADRAQTVNHNNAYDEHGRDVVPVTFITEVDFTHIDWVQTMAKNLILKNEREITVKNGTHLMIQGFMTANGNLDYEPFGPIEIHTENNF